LAWQLSSFVSHGFFGIRDKAKIIRKVRMSLAAAAVNVQEGNEPPLIPQKGEPRRIWIAGAAGAGR
jgi:hypothetical protein